MESMKSLNSMTKKLLQEHNLYRAPVDVFKLMVSLDINLRLEDMEDSMAGFIQFKESGDIVVINNNHHIHRQRFTGAHEIAHQQLHRDQASSFIDHSFKSGLSIKPEKMKNATFHRDQVSSLGQDVREIEANRFAARLLMPEELVVQKISEYSIDSSSDDDIQRLAGIFQISLQAMTYRLASLGVALC